ncbi:uncharacterized protein LOC110027287 [Phalaenopsis equestris]|uniref:uncharacterized protein LOC110027287 n=1 Tax=Phalaenopsis equestris TaxID=78828 RepID=UPI0009E4463E|nr:uncharacterized protein LOC110027287 [Phalaenopsis equestris]
MATLPISTIHKLPLHLLLLFFSLPIKANLSKIMDTYPTSNPNDYFLPAPTTTEYPRVESSAIAALGHYDTKAAYRTCADKCYCCLRDDPKTCSYMKCCFGIVCNLPGKPFGYCSFMPLSCYCDSCA